ncbi:hypothetical protein BA950_03630 [Erythrobacter sp. SAORIC-644]|nr:hypothetical protein [Sphingomonadaceae bacterium]MAG42435.1 hypothetical protein [Erythrobacteraceae bacterium]MBR38068.1 hypothetical protein [Idiomarina sp.]PNQ77446.1 hypothetical protein BA950_03630 [Erythrobacter sp. SAORIC-644]HCB78941.1 hypothetical protein [Erythrobacter sp.]
MALFAVVSLGAGIWLLLHLRDVARVFRGNRPGELVRGPGKRRATPAAVWTALIIFNAGWIACIVIWIFVLGGEANTVVDAKS